MHDHSNELTLGIAYFLGALHALEPGHGKTAMLVYLSGERRSVWHPIVMGLSSGVAHSVSLVVIALVVRLTHHCRRSVRFPEFCYCGETELLAR